MPEPLTINGLPRSLARDAWWMASDAAFDSPKQAKPGPLVGGRWSDKWPRSGGVAVLVILADFLFWSQSIGISLALFSIATFCVASTHLWPLHKLWKAGLIVLFGAAPVADYVQALSVAFLVTSLIVGLVWARLPQADCAGLGPAAIRFAAGVPGRIGGALLGSLQALRPRRQTAGTEVTSKATILLRNWGFPIGGTLVFTALLMDANPLINQIFLVQVDLERLILRGLFWGGSALMISAFVSNIVPDATPMEVRTMSIHRSIGINAGSVLRSLCLFNLLIAVQTVMDLSILIGGAELPRGMTYAAYAHRGAYPLLATALLAGAFALAANPFLGEHRALRPLMLLWLGQNVLLALSALLRLDVYVNVYGLTYLRLYAMIWMGLVAAALALTGVQVLLRRSNIWLVLRAAAIACITLYVCAFINFAQVIARANLAHPGPQDWTYLCDLGPMAAGPMRQVIRSPLDPKTIPGGYRQCAAFDLPPKAAGWRDFSFRVNRVRAYVGHVTPQGPSL